MSFESLLHTTESVTLLVWQGAVKGSIVLFGFGLATLLVRRMSAARAHFLWLAGLLAMILIPIVTVLLPQWSVPLAHNLPPAIFAASNKSEVNLLVVDFAQLNERERRQQLPKPFTHESASTKQSLRESSAPIRPNSAALAVSAIQWVFLVWLAGFLFELSRLALGWISLWRLQRTCQAVTAGRSRQVLHELARALGIKRSVGLWHCESRRIPMTWGIFRPRIILPLAAECWSLDRLRMVLLHELGHVRRWDCCTQILARMVHAVYWFHPLVWWAWRRLQTKQEQACDDFVLNTAVAPADYARELLAVSSGRNGDALIPLAAQVTNRYARLQQRIAAVLNPNQRRLPVNRIFAVSAILICSCLIAPLASIRINAAPGAAQKTGDNSAPKAAGKTPSTADIEEVKRLLVKHHLKSIDKNKIVANAIQGMIRALNDPHAAYLSAQQMADYDINLKGDLVGIGIMIRTVDKELAVITPLENSPALKAGVRAGDVIVAIGDRKTNGLALLQCVRLLRGKRGTQVRLQVRRAGGGVQELKVRRDRLRLPTVKGLRRGTNDRWLWLLDVKPKIGYMQITQFGPSTSTEVRQIVKRMQKQGLRGLILDLRFCPGGLMKEAIAVCDLFLAAGKILSVKGVKHKRTWEAKKATTLGKFPLLILVNGRTASAAEIVAGALQVNKRATLLGSRTYGKGTVQTLIRLKGGAALKLTTALHYLPNGRNIQRKREGKTWGVDPHDGFYLPIAKSQQAKLLASQRKRDILGIKRPKPKPIGAKQLAEKYADRQLAAALRSMHARLDSGKFKKVGKSLEELDRALANARKLEEKKTELRAELRRLQQQLDQSPSTDAWDAKRLDRALKALKSLTAKK